MRLRKKNANISVHAIAGTHVVLFGLDAVPATASKLLGFNILRTGPGDKQPTALESGREFAGVAERGPGHPVVHLGGLPGRAEDHVHVPHHPGHRHAGEAEAGRGARDHRDDRGPGRRIPGRALQPRRRRQPVVQPPVRRLPSLLQGRSQRDRPQADPLPGVPPARGRAGPGRRRVAVPRPGGSDARVHRTGAGCPSTRSEPRCTS